MYTRNGEWIWESIDVRVQRERYMPESIVKGKTSVMDVICDRWAYDVTNVMPLLMRKKTQGKVGTINGVLAVVGEGGTGRIVRNIWNLLW